MKRLLRLSALLALAIMTASSAAWADNAGEFTEIEGQVTVNKASGQSVQAVLGTMVGQGDLVVTERGSKATILFRDGSVLRLGPSTSLRINKMVYEEDKGIVDSAYELGRGTLMSIVGSLFDNEGSEYRVTTPTSVSGVRGSMNLLRVGRDPRTGRESTMAVGLEGITNFQGRQGGAYELGPRMYSMAGDDGVAMPPAQISEEVLQELLRLVTVGKKSLDQRAGGLRKRSEKQAPPEIAEPKIISDLILEEEELDPDDLPMGDNPEDLIYQEPPQFTELIIIVNMP